MKLHLAQPGATHVITAYGDGYVKVNQTRHEHSLVVLPDQVIERWTEHGFPALDAADMEVLARLPCEVLLLGTGRTLRFPPAELMRPLVRAGIGIEVMDLQAACRTYNILVAEERKVGAALIFE